MPGKAEESKSVKGVKTGRLTRGSNALEAMGDLSTGDKENVTSLP